LSAPSFEVFDGALEGFMKRYVRRAEEPDPTFRELYAHGKRCERAFLEQSTHALNNPRPDIVAKACIVVGAGKFTEAVPVLVSKLFEGNVLVTGPLVWALGEIGDLRAILPLETLWARGLMRETIAEAFAKIGDLDPVSHLSTALDEKDTQARLYTVGTIAALLGANVARASEYEGLKPRLERIMQHDFFAPIRVLAASALAALGRGFSLAELRVLLEMQLQGESLSPRESFLLRR
jgi:HEAT repeat protein